MKKLHLIGLFWVAFLVAGWVATATEYFFPTMLTIFIGIGTIIITGMYIADEWHNFK